MEIEVKLVSHGHRRMMQVDKEVVKKMYNNFKTRLKNGEIIKINSMNRKGKLINVRYFEGDLYGTLLLEEK